MFDKKALLILKNLYYRKIICLYAQIIKKSIKSLTNHSVKIFVPILNNKLLKKRKINRNLYYIHIISIMIFLIDLDLIKCMNIRSNPL